MIPATVLLLSVDEAAMVAHSLPAALAAVKRAGEAAAGHRVVVVDNASTDATAAIAARHPAAELVRLGDRVSYARAINAGLLATAGGGDDGAVLLLNADCFLDPGFLVAALPRLAEPGVGSVAPRLLRVSGPPAAPGAGPTDLGQIDAAGMSLDRRRKNGLVGHGAPPAAHDRPREVFGADGAAALYRRATLAACALPGGEVLDEDMALWATDADLAWRARLLGYRCVYEPAAIGRHVRTYSPSTRAAVGPGAQRLQFRNRLLMVAKNETAAGLRRDGLRILAYEVLALGYAVLRERHLLAGYVEAARLLPRARGRRRLIRARRVLDRPPFDG